MNLIDSLTLLGILIALAAMPSASVALVVARAATLGFGNGVAVAGGIVLGDLVFIAFSILGLSVIAEMMGGFFFAVKILGGLYLIWLGVGLLRSRGGSLEIDHVPGSEIRSLAASLTAGFVLTLGDVKAILFYLSLFPMFIDLTAVKINDITIIVVVTIVGVGLTKIVYALLATRIVQRSRGRQFARRLHQVAGGLMVGAGGYLVFKS